MKIEIHILNSIIDMLNQGLTDRKISDLLNISRYAIQQVVKMLKSGKNLEDISSQVCENCGLKLEMSLFTRRTNNNGFSFCPYCKTCETKIVNESHMGKNFEKFNLPTEIIDEQIIEIVLLRNKGVIIKDIAKILCIDHNRIYDIMERFQIPPLPRAFIAQFQKERICSKKDCEKAGELQSISEFDIKTSKTGRISHNSQCKKCRAKTNRVSFKKNYTTEKGRVYKNNGKEVNNARSRQRRKEDPAYRLREILSCEVGRALKKRGSSKNMHSCIKYFPWTIEQLLINIETLFSHPDNLTPDGKVWMTWKNQGIYNPKTWIDNDYSTHTWQLDHIIPHSTFHYKSMDCEEFRKCWSLDNLRPLSAKQNFIDGMTKVRHKLKEESINETKNNEPNDVNEEIK